MGVAAVDGDLFKVGDPGGLGAFAPLGLGKVVAIFRAKNKENNDIILNSFLRIFWRTRMSFFRWAEPFLRDP